ncbi:hypothetical protein [Synechococcus sp. H60.4]|uniref:hypothetical protein n=1 Tax=unclassified Synechococcus TaxID=2626047 RepID=UPI0039C03994
MDRDEERELCERVFRTPEYFYFSPETQEFTGLQLRGERHEEIEPPEQRWRWREVLGLRLGIPNRQLRYFFPSGELMPTPEEAEKIERQWAEQERQRAERLAQKLRELGVDPDTL